MGNTEKQGNKVNSAVDLGHAIRTRRKQMRFTQTKLAALCGVTKNFVYSLEKGKPTVHFEKALNVLNGVGLDLYMKERSI